MARPHLTAGTLRILFASLLVAAALAPADAYRILHVRTLAISVDRTRVRMGERLHLTVRAAVAEHVQALPELILPDLTAFQVLGDSERLERSSAGTTFVAVLTIAPNLPGPAAIGPAYLDAVDPRTHQALRYRSNALRVEVLPSAPSEVERIIARVRSAALLALLAAAGIIGLLVGRRRIRARLGLPPPLMHHPRQAIALPAASDTLAPWIARLRSAPTRATALAARAALWQRLGAQERETAEDVLLRTTGARWRRAVTAAERAAFVEPDAERAAARALADALEDVREEVAP